MEEAILTIYLCFWLAVFGSVLGSFLDCAASRWAAGERMFAGRSHCAACGHTLGAGDLVPVFSFLLRRGKCRYCGARIPSDCLWAELGGAAALACAGRRFGWSLALGQWLIFAAVLLALSLADAHRRVLPGRLLAVLAVNRAVWLLLLREDLKAAALAALAACAVPAGLLALVLLAEKIAGREVMGGGDIKLLFALALYLTWAQLLLALLAGCLAGLAWAALAGSRRGTAVAFGPFLAAGALYAVCWGEPLIQWYFGLF